MTGSFMVDLSVLDLIAERSAGIALKTVCDFLNSRYNRGLLGKSQETKEKI